MACRVALFERKFLASLGDVRLFSACPAAHNSAIVTKAAEFSVDLEIWIFLRCSRLAYRELVGNCHGLETTHCCVRAKWACFNVLDPRSSYTSVHLNLLQRCLQLRVEEDQSLAVRETAGAAVAI